MYNPRELLSCSRIISMKLAKRMTTCWWQITCINLLNPGVKPWVTQNFLTFDSVDRTLKCHHSLESCWAVPYRGQSINQSIKWCCLFFNFTQFLILENLSILDMALTGVKEWIELSLQMIAKEFSLFISRKCNRLWGRVCSELQRHGHCASVTEKFDHSKSWSGSQQSYSNQKPRPCQSHRNKKAKLHRLQSYVPLREPWEYANVKEQVIQWSIC